MIQEADAGRDLRSALAIEVGHQADVGLPGLADDLGEAMRLVQGSFPLFTGMANGRWQMADGKGSMATRRDCTASARPGLNPVWSGSGAAGRSRRRCRCGCGDLPDSPGSSSGEPEPGA